jgi:cytoplasmic FMR1 interacting protein
MVYTYRSCSKALPAITTQDEATKAEIYEAYNKVLLPEIQKLKDFLQFQQAATQLFCDHVKSIAEGMNLKTPQTFSEMYVYQLVKLLDLFSILDALKNMKACLNNDFSFFKRSFSVLRKTSGNDDQTQENQKLYMFLAQQNSISIELKKAVQNIAGFDDVLALIVNQCASYMEHKLYVTPLEMHRLIRVIPFGLLLMDGEKGDEKNNVFKSKKIRIGRFPPLFNKYPIVPLFGDMQITLENSIKRSAHFDEKAWGSTINLADAKLAQEYELPHQIDSIRAQNSAYLAKFSNMINRIKLMRKARPEVTQWSAAAVKSFVAVALEGLTLLGDWSGRVQRQSAWKYAHPINDPSIADMVEYEAVVRRNYSENELRVLLELIGIVKGLARVMLKYETLLMPIIRLNIHTELQEMIHVHLREATMSASKKKRPIREEMVHLRDLAADWPEGAAPDADPAIFGKKAPKGSKADSPQDYPTRVLGPSCTQLEYVRTLIYGFLAWKISGRKCVYSDKDLESKSIKLFEDFYQASFFWRHLLDYSKTVLECTDFSDLWYREFYLEMCKSDKFPQFPIEMSLPWILTENVLDSNDATLTEYMFYPLDIYNDSARRALTELKQKFLFDEVEAELNLCLDQLVFKLSEQVFEHAKIEACYPLLEREYRSSLEIVSPDQMFVPPRSRMHAISRQRHFTLLGRTLDLNSLIAQRLNTKLRQNLDYAIQRFTSGELYNIVKLEFHLTTLRATHRLLSRTYHIDDFDVMMNETNENVAVNSFVSRILRHILSEFEFDLFPHFNFVAATNRFILSPVPSSEEVNRDPAPKDSVGMLFGSKSLNTAFDSMFLLYQNFVGLPHFVSLVRVLGTEGVGLLVSEVINSWGHKLRTVIDPYFRELLVGMPANSRLPLFDYKTEGNYGYWANNLKDILAYPELNPQVFQQFKEVGNVVALMVLLDSAMAVSNSQDFLMHAPFLGVTLESANVNPSDSPLVRAVRCLGAAGSSTALPSLASPLEAGAASMCNTMRPTNSCFLRSVFAQMDRRMEFVRAGWCGNPPENGVMSVESTAEFYRLFSALLFLFADAPSTNYGPTNMAMFGDGFVWGGMTLLYLLDQVERFNCFDFTHHVLNVNDVYPADPNNAALQAFLRHAVVVRDEARNVISLISRYYPRRRTNFTLYAPPSTESQTEFIQNTADISGAESKPAPPLSARSASNMGPGTSARASVTATPPPAAEEETAEDDEEDLPPPPLPRDDDYDDDGGEDLPPPPLPRDDDDDYDDDDAPPPLPRDDDDDY